ncbi:MAG: bacillithiol biosynthesis cysteine-adding enzyme BshC [Bacteroidetes bacterium]|nr:bacillithiol biosynthesis cysteine-adding enzyme BshC [Bacteroidota bacterium]
MNSSTITYQQTGYFSKLIIDYLNENEKLTSFYNLPFKMESFAQLIEQRKSMPINRSVLVQSLQKQYQAVAISELTNTNILKLSSENTFTVTTGHQLNLFTGPLYFIYKIISTINLAKSLKNNYPEFNFVPVYWMATEDHDFEEINHFNVFGNKITLPKTYEGAVGKMKLTGVQEVLNQLKEILGNRSANGWTGSQTEELINLFGEFYTEQKTFAEATRAFVNHLFGKYGLVIIDGDDTNIKKQMVEEFKVELTHQQNVKIINETTAKLEALGYKSQITPREINLFYLQENSRERIVFEDGLYHVLNTSISFSEPDIMTELETHPESFSPNVALRPLYQEKILPNLAYIGGGGELAYWFQLKEMFDVNQISFPILVLRNSALIVDEGNKKRLDKMGISVKHLFGDTDLFINQFLKEGAEVVLDLKKEENEIALIFNEMITKAEKIDATLKPMISAELQKTLKIIRNIEGRLIKAEKQKEEVTINQFKNIKEKLFPKGSLQERQDNLILLFLLMGFDVIDQLMPQLNPLEEEFKVIEL